MYVWGRVCVGVYILQVLYPSMDMTLKLFPYLAIENNCVKKGEVCVQIFFWIVFHLR